MYRRAWLGPEGLVLCCVDLIECRNSSTLGVALISTGDWVSMQANPEARRSVIAPLEWLEKVTSSKRLGQFPAESAI